MQVTCSTNVFTMTSYTIQCKTTRHKCDYEYDGITHKVCIHGFRPIANAMSMPAPISHIVHNYY